MTMASYFFRNRAFMRSVHEKRVCMLSHQKCRVVKLQRRYPPSGKWRNLRHVECRWSESKLMVKCGPGSIDYSVFHSCVLHRNVIRVACCIVDKLSVDLLTHYAAAQFTDTASQPPERIRVRATVKSSAFTNKHPAWSALPFPTDEEWIDKGMRFFEPALAAPISAEIADDAARDSDDVPMQAEAVEHAVIDAPGSAFDHLFTLGPPAFNVPPILPFTAGGIPSLELNDPAFLMAQHAQHSFLKNASHKRPIPE